jgi:hypothetical protein
MRGLALKFVLVVIAAFALGHLRAIALLGETQIGFPFPFFAHGPDGLGPNGAAEGGMGRFVGPALVVDLLIWGWAALALDWVSRRRARLRGGPGASDRGRGSRLL